MMTRALRALQSGASIDSFTGNHNYRDRSGLGVTNITRPSNGGAMGRRAKAVFASVIGQGGEAAARPFSSRCACASYQLLQGCRRGRNIVPARLPWSAIEPGRPFLS
jgi:hypothetical protein